MDQAILDMARDWVNLNHPGLDGAEHDAKVDEAAAEMAAEYEALDREGT